MTHAPPVSLAISGLLLAAAIWTFTRYLRVRRWTVVEAVVEEIRPVGRYRILAGQPGTAHLDFLVSARFNADGTEYRVRFSSPAPPADRVSIRYDPGDPSQWVARKPSIWPVVALLGVSLIFFVTAI